MFVETGKNFIESFFEIKNQNSAVSRTNDFVNLGICKHEFKFTCRGYCLITDD